MAKDLINFNDPKSVAEFLRAPAVKIAEFITGVLVSDGNDLKLAAGHLVQASIQSKFFQQLGEEISALQEKGKIKAAYLEDQNSLEALHDILSFIDETPPNEHRFNAMKKLFIKSIEIRTPEPDQILSHHFMRICRELESEDLLILKAAYDISIGKVSNQLVPDSSHINLRDQHAQNWLNAISRQIGHGLMGLVEIREDRLVNLKLISPRVNSDRSGILVTDHFRLTDTGYRLCEFLYKE